MPTYETESGMSLNSGNDYDDLAPKKSGSGLRNVLIGVVIVAISIFLISYFWSNSSSNEGTSNTDIAEDESVEELEKEPPPLNNETETATDEGSNSPEGGSLGGGASYDNILLLENRAATFGDALFAGKGEEVHEMLSDRCANSIADTNAYATSIYESVGGADFDPIKNLKVSIEDPHLGISFVTYKPKDSANSLEVYFLWNGTNWVMDSCNN